MVDSLTSLQRSIRMSKIRSSNTSPELAIRKGLHSAGLRFRLKCSTLPGKPDLVFARYRVALFVHGCFWHQHRGCKISHVPKSNSAFWQEKFLRNVARDKRVGVELREIGWRVVVVWECELKPCLLQSTVDRVASEIRSGVPDWV